MPAEIVRRQAPLRPSRTNRVRLSAESCMSLRKIDNP
jgi:hypothetical protein